MRDRRLASASDLYRAFIVEMRRYARSRNRTLHVWEGFTPPRAPAAPAIPTDVVVT
eukprot:gene6967-8591_t